ncbi:MAG: hypothetical protein AAGG07_10985 [Planctomycetota bacterium]
MTEATDQTVLSGSSIGRRPIAWALLGVSLVGLLVGSLTLFDRIGDFNADRPRTIFYRNPLMLREFLYAGREVELMDALDENGAGEITLRYGNDSVEIPVAIPNANDLDGLERHEDWFRVLRVIEAEPGASFEQRLAEVERGEREDMLVVVTRTPDPGKNDGAIGLKVDPDAWGYGEVMRKHWTFDFYRLNPDGGIERETLRFPSTRRHQDPKEGELAQGTWQYDAAASVMPKGSEPKANFTQRALTQAGWALGVSGVSVMLLAFSTAWLLAPTRDDIERRIARAG